MRCSRTSAKIQLGKPYSVYRAELRSPALKPNSYISASRAVAFVVNTINACPIGSSWDSMSRTVWSDSILMSMGKQLLISGVGAGKSGGVHESRICVPFELEEPVRFELTDL